MPVTVKHKHAGKEVNKDNILTVGTQTWTDKGKAVKEAGDCCSRQAECHQLWRGQRKWTQAHERLPAHMLLHFLDLLTSHVCSYHLSTHSRGHTMTKKISYSCGFLYYCLKLHFRHSTLSSLAPHFLEHTRVRSPWSPPASPVSLGWASCAHMQSMVCALSLLRARGHVRWSATLTW